MLTGSAQIDPLSRLLLLLSVAAAVALAGAPARAQPSPRAAVVTVAGSQASRAQADVMAKRLVRRLPSDSVLLPEGARAAFGDGGGRETVERAQRLAAEARAELAAFEDLERTASLLDGALEAYLHALPLLDSLDDPLRLAIDLATVEVALDRGERVREILEVATRLDPALDLDPREMPSRLVQASREAAEAARDQPLLDWRFASRLGAGLEVERLVVVQPWPDAQRARVELYDVSSGQRTGVWTVETEGLAGVGDELASELGGATTGEVEATGGAEGGDLPAEPVEFSLGGGSAPSPEGEARSPWYRRWWVWTLIGVAVLGGAAAGVYFGLFYETDTMTIDFMVEGHW